MKTTTLLGLIVLGLSLIAPATAATAALDGAGPAGESALSCRIARISVEPYEFNNELVQVYMKGFTVCV